MTYSTSESTPVKKTVQELSAEYRPYWQPVFDTLPNPNPSFTAKLCYMGKEFSPRQESIRLFPSELNNENGLYMEMYNWDFGYYHEGTRTLYHLPYDPDWKNKKEKFKEITNSSAGVKLNTSTYAIRLSDLTVVSRNPLSALAPTPLVKETPGFTTPEDLFNEQKLSDMFSDEDDNHYTQMTIRDLYCMLNNIPLSNKRWLNQLIEKGRKWQK